MAEDLAHVLELLHGSAKRWRTLRAEGEDWRDDVVSGEAFLRSVPRGGRIGVRGSPGPVERDLRWRVWIRQPDHSRADHGGPHDSSMTSIVSGGRQWVVITRGGDRRVHESHGDPGFRLGPAAALLDPATLPAFLDLEVQADTVHLGRRAVDVRGRFRSPSRREGPSWRLPMGMGADELEMAVDLERGVLLWMEARLEGAPFHRVTTTAVAFDEPIDDALFAPPEDIEPERLGQMDAQPVVRRTGPGGPPPPRGHGPGPPDGVLGHPVAAGPILGRTPSTVIAVHRIVAYPSGFELYLTVRSREAQGQRSFDETHRRTWSGTSAFPGESLRVGVVYADGRKASSRNFGERGNTRTGVTLVPLDGSGTDARFDQRFWVEPLPPPGPLRITVEWPGRDLAETGVDVDGRAVADAAAQAETLW